jgi:succinate-semialdehyde dehydrogenase/glutarate-semialdehyde dehydrogenase
MASVSEIVGRHSQAIAALLAIPRATGGSTELRSPLTGEAITTLQLSTTTDVAEAFAAARKAQADWAQTSMHYRAAILHKFETLVMGDQSTVLDYVQIENGKARGNAHDELLDVVLTAQYYAKNGARYLKTKKRQGAFPIVTRTREVHHPIGVIGFISPWNYPLTLAISDMLPALLAGNAAVLKPDMQTPFSALWAVAKLFEAGVPRDLIQVVLGEGSDLGPDMVANADYIMFTGSTRVGRIVAAGAGQRLIGASMELGGKNSMIIDSSVNVDHAVQQAMRGAFANAGQLCIGTERIAVHADIYDEFSKAFAKAVDAMRIQNHVGWGSDLGVLINQRQLETTERHIADAVSKGARVIAGGSRDAAGGPLGYRPTVLVDVPESAEVCNSETFGPVCSLYKWSDEAELVKFVNNTEYGLSASIVSKRTAWANQLARKIKAGAVNINDSFAAAYASIDAPMGGMKASGVDRRHGAQGILKYTESQTIAEQRWINLGPQKGMTDESWARFTSKSLKYLKWFK